MSKEMTDSRTVRVLVIKIEIMVRETILETLEEEVKVEGEVDLTRVQMLEGQE